MRKQTEIFSIFGQIEAVVAQSMIDEGTANRIEPDDIPASVRYNEFGERAKFAIVIAANNVPSFNRRVKQLRA